MVPGFLGILKSRSALAELRCATGGFEATFDIEHWISYAKSTAVSLGLTLDSSATDCWDNPITADQGCIYLERDINSRLKRYAEDESITDICIWYECIGTGSYLIYIGYA